MFVAIATLLFAAGVLILFYLDPKHRKHSH